MTQAATPPANPKTGKPARTHARTRAGTRASVTTHVLDTARGVPAEGLVIEVFRLGTDGTRQPLTHLVTNADGRTDAPVVPPEQMAAGSYELVFHAGAYLAAAGLIGEDGVPFLDAVPIRFGISDPARHHHVPLLLSPFGYSTYRGS
ncbi:hydroxyisourate hydrolase [Stappia taiwanensis]|uniref:5-hydroxyisourate hydrolase n=1 Tax=Stappia taiwanensis TaxID=992267 RepID=A0A838XX93_9HYPH|nr:hydroxyisourate hydrolase [Stappia taiwanensis]MBA4611410.1 hydroxyisourate hydrolase [Stappia taiwanensis]GGF00504.1 5-hydroxyisourate hydrolase [Stappia taiwanensis]